MERSRVRRALVCPIGFVADHLEILFDIDVEAMAFAREHGIELRRTPSFNARPELIDALSAVVRDALMSGRASGRASSSPTGRT
jgi:ferrochelatase